LPFTPITRTLVPISSAMEDPDIRCHQPSPLSTF
jgi:hypothetical protein